MLYTALYELTDSLNDYLNAFYEAPEGMAELGTPDADIAEAPDKLLVGLVNLERETALGIAGDYRPSADGGYVRQAPPWYLNVYVVVAAVFGRKRYAESLKVLSKALGFLQRQASFQTSDGQTYTLEPISADTQALTNLWSILGSRYYPSVICKLRRLVIDSNESAGSAAAVGRVDSAANG